MLTILYRIFNSLYNIFNILMRFKSTIGLVKYINACISLFSCVFRLNLKIELKLQWVPWCISLTAFFCWRFWRLLLNVTITNKKKGNEFIYTELLLTSFSSYVRMVFTKTWQNMSQFIPCLIETPGKNTHRLCWSLISHSISGFSLLFHFKKIQLFHDTTNLA